LPDRWQCLSVLNAYQQATTRAIGEAYAILGQGIPIGGFGGDGAQRLEVSVLIFERHI
jgi:hypothetical protein